MGMDISLTGGLGSLYQNLGVGGFDATQFQAKLQDVDKKDLLVVLSELFRGEGTETVGETNVIDDLDAPEDTEITPEKQEKSQKNLEKIIGSLKMRTDEKQVESTKERIKANTETIKNKHKAQLDKISDSIKEAEKAEKNSTIGKIFGWIGAALAVAVAAVACVATGGIAVGPCIAAAIAVTSLVISSVDSVQKAVCEGLGELCDSVKQAFGGKPMTQDEKRMAGSIMFGAITLVASIACCCIPSNAVVQLFETSAKVARMATVLQTASKILSGVLGLGNTGVSIAGGILNKGAADAQAEAKEIQRYLVFLQQMQDEEQEQLQQLLEQIQNNLGVLANMMQNKVNNIATILNNMGNDAAGAVL